MDASEKPSAKQCGVVREFYERGFWFLDFYTRTIDLIEGKWVPRLCQLSPGHGGYHRHENRHAKYEWRAA